MDPIFWYQNHPSQRFSSCSVNLWCRMRDPTSSQKWIFFLEDIQDMFYSRLFFISATPLIQPSPTCSRIYPAYFSQSSSCSYSLNQEQVIVYFFVFFFFISLSLFFLISSSTSFSGTIPLLIIFCLNSLMKRGFPRLLARLFLARVLRREGVSKTPPIPLSFVYIKEIRPVSIVLIFHAELQVSLWQWVKVVQMALPTSKRPFSVRNLIFGGEKGQSSGSSSTPWQKPWAKSSSRPKRQKWKWRDSRRVTSACWCGYFSRDCSSFCRRSSVIFLFIRSNYKCEPQQKQESPYKPLRPSAPKHGLKNTKVKVGYKEYLLYIIGINVLFSNCELKFETKPVKQTLNKVIFFSYNSRILLIVVVPGQGYAFLTKMRSKTLISGLYLVHISRQSLNVTV